MLATLRAVFRTAYFLEKWTLNILSTYPQTIENKITIVMVYHFIFPIVEIKSVNEPENILKLKNRSSKRHHVRDPPIRGSRAFFIESVLCFIGYNVRSD